MSLHVPISDSLLASGLISKTLSHDVGNKAQLMEEGDGWGWSWGGDFLFFGWGGADFQSSYAHASVC